MKPRRWRYVYAEKGFGFTTVGPALLASLATALGFFPSLVLAVQTRQWMFIPWYVFAVVLASPLGFMFGFLMVWTLTSSIIGKLNGAPFRVGDRVRVLVGPHRDRVLDVYAVWPEYRSVRLGLGEREKSEVADVLSYNQICRES